MDVELASLKAKLEKAMETAWQKLVRKAESDGGQKLEVRKAKSEGRPKDS